MSAVPFMTYRINSHPAVGVSSEIGLFQSVWPYVFFSRSRLRMHSQCVLQFAQGTVFAKTYAMNHKGDGLDQMVSVDWERRLYSPRHRKEQAAATNCSKLER